MAGPAPIRRDRFVDEVVTVATSARGNRWVNHSMKLLSPALSAAKPSPNHPLHLHITHRGVILPGRSPPRQFIVRPA